MTITGTGFLPSPTSGAGTSLVSFANSIYPAPITSWSDTQIVATVPTYATTGPVNVGVNGQPSNLVNYTVPNNVVSNVSPTTGPVGTQATITGRGFGATQGTSTLTFSGQLPASIASWSDTQIIATVPVTATTGPIAVAVNSIPSNITVLFTVPPPAITTMSPAGGLAGTQITSTGSGFQANQRNSTVTFNGVAAAITSWSHTQIVTTVPNTATTGPLLVSVNSVSNGSSNVFVVPNLTIASIDPPAGPAFDSR